jgi:hypothetical protein
MCAQDHSIKPVCFLCSQERYKLKYIGSLIGSNMCLYSQDRVHIELYRLARQVCICVYYKYSPPVAHMGESSRRVLVILFFGG